MGCNVIISSPFSLCALLISLVPPKLATISEGFKIPTCKLKRLIFLLSPGPMEATESSGHHKGWSPAQHPQTGNISLRVLGNYSSKGVEAPAGPSFPPQKNRTQVCAEQGCCAHTHTHRARAGGAGRRGNAFLLPK